MCAKIFTEPKETEKKLTVLYNELKQASLMKPTTN